MHKCTNSEVRDVASATSIKKINRCRSFHFRYLELCRSKNLTPLIDIRTKNNATSVLDFFGDKLNVNDWLLIVEALYYDQVLQTLAIRMRKTLSGMVLDHLDSEKKAKLFRQKPVIYTKFVFTGVVEAVSNCIEFNKNLRILNLEGLPLNDKYVESIAKALSSNESVKEISFQRSNIYDKGCEAICNTIKYLEHVEKLNLADCELTTKGAEFVADMIKIQKISRYTEGWQKSLRYRDVDPDTIPGLRSITLARNPQIGDDGLKCIVEVLKEDVWIKVIDMEHCGLTDRAANMILDCLEINNYIIDFNVRNNVGISKFLQRSIRDQLGKDDEDQKLMEGSQELVTGPNGIIVKRPKVTMTHLKEQLKTLEEQLAFERVLRKKAEQLNEKLNHQIIAYENQMENDIKANIPEGYVVVKNESLQSIIRERNDFQKLVNGTASHNTSPRNSIKHNARSSSKQINQQKQQQQQLEQQIQQQLQLQQQHKQQLQPSPNESYVERENVEYEQVEDDSDTECESQMAPNSPTLPITSKPVITTTHKEKRKSLKVRKVRSEMKYVEPVSNRDVSKKKISKSDHEFTNESDINAVYFERNIGDTASNNSGRSQNSSKTLANSSTMNQVHPSHNDKKVNYIYNNSNNGNSKSFPYENLTKFDLDDLSIPTTRSVSSDVCSSDSDTLRNDEFQPLKVFIRRPKTIPQPLTPIPQGKQNDSNEGQEFGYFHGEGDGSGKLCKSPRSLFFGLCDD